MGGEKKHCRDKNCNKCHKKTEFSVKNLNWPKWGHDNHNTFSNVKEKKICKDNVTTLTEKWNFEYGVYGDSEFAYTEPIVVGEIVYLFSAFGAIYALNLDGTPYINFGVGGVVLLDANRYAPFSTQLVFGDYIYVVSLAFSNTNPNNPDEVENFYINSFNRFTGVNNPNWPNVGAVIPMNPFPPHTLQEALDTSEITASLTAVDDCENPLIFIAVTNSGFDAFQKGALTAYDLSGNIVWSEIIEPNSGAGTGSWSTPSFDTKRKLMYYGTTNQKDFPIGNDSDALQARNYRTGKLVWNYQYVSNDVAGNLYPFGIYGNPTYLMDRDIGASPNIFDVCHRGNKRELVGVCGKDGIYRTFDRQNGDLAWQTVISTTPTIWGNPSAAYNKGVIYVTSTSDIDQDVVGNADPIPYQSYSQLILGGGSALKSFLFSKGILMALNAATGKIIWKQEFPSLFFGGPTYANEIVYTGSYDGTIRALDAKTGNILFTTLTPPQVVIPIPMSSNCFVPCNITISDGTLYIPYLGLISPSGVLALTPSALCENLNGNKVSGKNLAQKTLQKLSADLVVKKEEKGKYIKERRGLKSYKQ